MRILYYNEQFNARDGSSNHAKGLLNGLYKCPDIEKVITWPKTLISNVKRKRVLTRASFPYQIGRYIKRKSNAILSSRKIIRYINEESKILDFLIARYSTFDEIPYIISQKLKIPFIAEVNTPFFYEIGKLRRGALVHLVKKWEKKMLKASSKVYVVSNVVAEMLSNEYGINKEKFIVIPNGYDSSIYPNSAKDTELIRKRIRNYYNLENKFMITFLGSLKAWHGIDVLIDLAKLLHRVDKDIVLVIIGDGEMREIVSKATSGLDNLKWMGHKIGKEMSALLIASDIGIMPYPRIEKFYFSPLKLYDMVGAALPFIATPQGQIKEFMDDFPGCGWSIEPNNVEGIVKTILRLKNNPTIIRDARKKLWSIRNKHTWQTRAIMLTDIIRNT